MIETTVSNDLVYLCMLHYEYLSIMEKSKAYEYKPISIIQDKDKMFTLTVELNSNQQIDNNDSTRDSEFSKRTPRLSSLG